MPGRSFLLVLSFAWVSLVSLAGAQVYTKQPILMGLDQPRGIAVASNGDLYFTEVPTPGVAGPMGGMNRVSKVDAQTGTISVIETGMPEPLNLAIHGTDVFWTCRTAGVIFQRTATSNQIYMQGLNRPTGIYATSDAVYVTQVPTPGVPGSQGGTNTVDRIASGNMMNLSMGEPEPADVVVAPNGDAYWTCRTAGVILKRDGATGMKSMVARGLEFPTGLAMDNAGVLYFTDVPTPGVFGTNGGRNKVWRLDPATKVFTLISIGEPEPTDVTVSADGSSVYWTCTTAGVIFRADLVGDAPMVSSPTGATTGATTRFFLDAPGNGGKLYIAGSSFGLGPVPVGGDYVALADDALLRASVGSLGNPFFVGYMGMLDANGMATVHLAIPNDPSLVDTDFYTAFVVMDGAMPQGVGGISGSLRMTVQ